MGRQEEKVINRIIHPKDSMYYTNADLTDEVLSEKYWAWAESAVRICKRVNRNAKHILDFGGAYGRCSRVFVEEFPDATVTVHDRIEDCIIFCRDVLGQDVAQTEEEIPRNYFDLIWCGSVFTHLPQNRWEYTFELLSDCLRPNGHLVFTTSSERATIGIEKVKNKPNYGVPIEAKGRFVNSYRKYGYAFQQYPSIDVETEMYGCCHTSLDWNKKFIDQSPHFNLESQESEAWRSINNCQDVNVCIKINDDELLDSTK